MKNIVVELFFLDFVLKLTNKKTTFKFLKDQRTTQALCRWIDNVIKKAWIFLPSKRKRKHAWMD